LQNTFETLETYAYNMRLFWHNVTLLLRRKEFIVVELVASAEVGGGAWSSPVRQQSGEHCTTWASTYSAA
jgi:hypothetical protein